MSTNETPRPEVANNPGIFIPDDSTPRVDTKTILQFLEGEAISYKAFAQLLYEQSLWKSAKYFTQTLICAFLVEIYRDGRQIYDSKCGKITHITNEQPKELAIELAGKLDLLHAITVVTEGVNYSAAPNGALLSVEVTDWREEPNFVLSRFDFAEWKRYHNTDILPRVIQAVDVGYWYQLPDGEHRYEEPVAEWREKR